MSEPISSNPFAAPQADPGQVEEPAMDDSHLLTAVEVELSRMRPWVWITGVMFAVLAVYGMVIFFLILLGGLVLLGAILNLIMLSLYTLAAVLVLRLANKLSEFQALPRPFQMEEVFVSHAASWKYLGIVSLTLLLIFALLVIRDLMTLI